MKVIKYEHACLFIESDNGILVIDPGKYTNLPTDLKNIQTIVVTEEHLDHFDASNLKKIIEQSPDAKIFSTNIVCEQLEKLEIKCTPISDKKTIEAGGLKLHFSEGDHAPTYKNSPCRVLTIQIDDFLYYPSDSFITTENEVQILALPTGGPWNKIEEAVDCANAIKSKYILATHNAHFNDLGQDTTNSFISMNIADQNREYVYLKVGESREF